MNDKPPIIIIGAGLAGLAAGITLKKSGLSSLIFESSKTIGGRVATDEINGFLLDRGFQVLIKSYPEAERFLDYKALDLKPFLPGVIILNDSGRQIIIDPIREPKYLLTSIFSPIGSFQDKIKVLLLKRRLKRESVNDIFSKPEKNTKAYLESLGFSQNMMDSFFKPFLNGVFLGSMETTSSRMFEFVFKLMGEGETTIPAKGMGEIPKQMASKFGWENIHLDEPVLDANSNQIITSKGTYNFSKLIFACGRFNLSPQIKNIVYSSVEIPKEFNSAYTLYFSSNNNPSNQNILFLNATQNNLVNTLTVLNNISSFYAPKGQYLISLSLTNNYSFYTLEELINEVRREMSIWFKDAFEWEFIKDYFIPHALSCQNHVVDQLHSFKVKGSENYYIAGDFLLNGSINGALKSGRMAAEEIIQSETSHF